MTHANPEITHICSAMVCLQMGSSKAFIPGDVLSNAMDHLPMFKALWKAIDCEYCRSGKPMATGDNVVQLPIHTLPEMQISFECLQLCIYHKAGESMPSTKRQKLAESSALSNLAQLLEGIYYLNGTLDSLAPLFASVPWHTMTTTEEGLIIRRILNTIGTIPKMEPDKMWWWSKIRESLSGHMLKMVYSKFVAEHKPLEWLFDDIDNLQVYHKKKQEIDNTRYPSLYEKPTRYIQ